MKFNLMNKNKLLIIILSSFVITSFGGCKDKKNYPAYSTTQIETSTKNKITNETSSEIENNTNQYSENDILIINEFKNIEKELNEILENDKNFLNETRAFFIIIVDFIFCDSEINGVKFDDLTDSAKQEILQISSNIDIKLENKFPNYKNEISENAENVLSKASELIKLGASNINEFTKEKLGDDNYITLIEVKDELIDYTKNALDVISDFSLNLYDNGKKKIKNWYDELKKN